MMLFAAVAAASALTLWAVVETYNWFFNRGDEDLTAESVSSYYSDAEWFETPQVGIKYVIEDQDGIDAQDTVEAVAEWIREDEPNIISGKWQAQVDTLADTGLVQISGDASALLLDNYADVELPYVDNDGDLKWVTVDLDFA